MSRHTPRNPLMAVNGNPKQMVAFTLEALSRAQWAATRDECPKPTKTRGRPSLKVVLHSLILSRTEYRISLKKSRTDSYGLETALIVMTFPNAPKRLCQCFMR